jgi:gamma-glutamyl phosphate reductase
MSLWTPGGEHPVEPNQPSQPEPTQPAAQDAGGTAPEVPNLEDLSPEERAQVEAMASEMEEVRKQISSAPAADVVANHAMGIYELAAIHLTSEPPKLEEAQLAIDALAAIVDNLTGRLGQGEPTLIEARQQLQMAFVQRSQQAGD